MSMIPVVKASSMLVQSYKHGTQYTKIPKCGGEPFLSFRRSLTMDFPHGEITEQIIGAAFEVHRELGYGFLEKVDQRAMQVERINRKFKAELESKITVFYKNVIVGEYFADLFVEEKVVVELKVAKVYNSVDEAQLLNQLQATGISVGLLINFGREKVEFKRIVF